MSKPIRFLFTAGLGAAAMYYFDPVRGRDRRTFARDRLDRGRPGDEALAQRVRAGLARVVADPRSIRVEANDGVVTLAGPIPEDELPLLIDCTLGIRGVRDLDNRLEVHREGDDVPGLPSGWQRRNGARSGSGREDWSPAVRASGGAAGAAAVLCGAGRGGLGGLALGTAGLLLLTRAVTNLELRRLFGIGMSRHAIDVQKNLRIRAPVEEVFRLWDNFENFPEFMTHVREVRPIHTRVGKQRWHWVVTGPTGTRFEFDSVVTAREENRLLAWRTEGSSPVQHAGRVHFRDNGDDSTTVDVKMTYNPVIGAVGHAIAWLFGKDPKHQMDDDLLRMKRYLETGKAPRRAAASPETSPGEARPVH